jgi:hypothetical protein
MLNSLFSRFDRLLDAFGVFKVRGAREKMKGWVLFTVRTGEAPIPENRLRDRYRLRNHLPALLCPTSPGGPTYLPPPPPSYLPSPAPRGVAHLRYPDPLGITYEGAPVGRADRCEWRC